MRAEDWGVLVEGVRAVAALKELAGVRGIVSCLAKPQWGQASTDSRTIVLITASGAIAREN